MASSLAIPSHAGTRNLRSSTAKTSTASGPSNISLFLRNLRLLNLDQREDWPGITEVTFSTKDTQQNQKKRIQCVEWALYHLFTIWDLEESRNKLRPFFPPLEPLQSLNLRTALFRCLDNTKKEGVLGRDAVLRKTMLDDCKGERLEEILATFSNAVLKKVIRTSSETSTLPIAQQLAFENFSYSGERTALFTLILAHKTSLHSHLRKKDDATSRYRDFADLLKLNDRRITRRHEQLKEAALDRRSLDALSTRDIQALHDKVTNNWSGREEWLETILYGDAKVREDDLLAANFDSVWSHVEDGSLGDVEEKKHIGLLQQLDARVRNQEARLATWQDFRKRLVKSGPPSPSKTKDPAISQGRKIDLGFNLHQSLQISHSKTGEIVQATTHKSIKEYTQLIDEMKMKLEDVGRSPAQARLSNGNLFPEATTSNIAGAMATDESPSTPNEWSSVSDIEEAQPDVDIYAKEASMQSGIHPQSGYLRTESNYNITLTEDLMAEVSKPTEDPHEAEPKSQGAGSPSPNYPRSQTPPPIAAQDFSQSMDSDSDLADQILNSVSASSPSPKKARYTLSLAERTRLSMSRVSHSQYSDLHDDIDNLADLPLLPAKSRSQLKAASSPAEEMHAGLIERTRQSMAGFEAAQKKAQLERRRSIKDAKKQQRASSYFPVLDEEPSRGGIDPVELIEGEPDYESVFKSRPKIKTSPAVSPTRTGNEE
ncbi:hypothetical protein OIDMADRAFT_187355 [Oidiodendron maius Zn]|uniref:HAUS augmin-like complex subunit 6 N-terminal domain-containing protein n=1 Tax=Oidiodendron maius (strain Zn) TaxID=913774 RepID=A0A0C3E1I8_OIDMZ|nr:hypothetical protein OIDMADRAFT_187355 [Oidiodendron maius Zn]